MRHKHTTQVEYSICVEHWLQRTVSINFEFIGFCLWAYERREAHSKTLARPRTVRQLPRCRCGAAYRMN